MSDFSDFEDDFEDDIQDTNNFELQKDDNFTPYQANRNAQTFSAPQSNNQGNQTFNRSKVLYEAKTDLNTIRISNLLKYVTLSTKINDIFTKNPTHKNDVFTGNIRAGFLVHNKTQTNKSDISIYIQTEEIKYGNAECQIPDDIVKEGNTVNKLNELDYTSLDHLGKSLKLMENILKYSFTVQNSNENNSKNQFYISRSLHSWEPVLTGRPLVDICDSPRQPESFISAYGPGGKYFQNSSIICLWKWSEYKAPIRIFICNGIIKSSYVHDNHIIIGCDDGNLSLFNLRETPQNYNGYTYNGFHLEDSSEIGCPIQYYNFTSHNTKLSSIVSISNCEFTTQKSQSNNDILYQICTIDSGGIVTIWNVIQLHYNINQSLGLKHNNNIIIVDLLTVNTNKSCFNNIVAYTESLPNSILCYNGLLGQISKVSLISTTNNMATIFNSCFEIKLECIYIAVCPFIPHLLLISWKGGFISLYSTNTTEPYCSFNISTQSSNIIKIMWIEKYPGIICCLDYDGIVSFIKINGVDLSPIEQYEEKNKITSLTISQNTTATNPPNLILGFIDNTISVLPLNSKFFEDSEREFKQYLSTII